MEIPVPKPRPDEAEDAFKSRCISTLHETDPNRPDDQIIAMCMTAWRDSQKDADHDLRFTTSIHQLHASSDGNLATFYLMNTARNRNKWGVTHEALQHALPTIRTVALGCGEDYDTSTHFGARMKVGEFIKGRMPDGYALGTATVSDDYVWEQLKAGEWGPISVVIGSFREVCSKCGEKLTGQEDPMEHECVAKGDAYVLVESFRFKKVDFIDTPAYPQAGVTELGGAAEPIIIAPLELVAGFYESQSTTWPERAGGRAPGSPNPDEKVEKKMSELTKEQLADKVKELTDSSTDLEAQLKTVTTERDDLSTKLEAALEDKDTPDDVEEDPKYKDLEAKVDTMEKERHDSLIASAVDARFKAGLSTDKAAETMLLADYTDAYLKLLTEDADKVASKLEAVSTGPKSKYGKEETDTFKAALEERREQMYGYTRDASGKVVA